MANRVVPWNNLPTELLEAIGKRLKNKIDVSQFRAICRSWRSSVPPFDQKQPRLPIRIMMKFPFPVNCFFLTITQNLVYHLVPPPDINSDASASASASTSSTRGWVVRLKEGESGETSMLHPLSSSFHIKRLPKSVFPKLLNLLEFQVFELAKTYTLYHSDQSVSSHRVAISLSPDWPAIMVVAAGKLYHCKLGPDIEMCTMLKDITSELFEDVICFEGKFYAVCHNSTAVVVDPTLIASPISPDHGSGVHCIKNLVESLGEILLVERYPSRMKQRRFVPVKFRVYKLNAVERKWVEMEGLDGRILCVGDNNCCFSVPAGDFTGCQRSCIYFSDPFFTKCYSNYSLGRKFKIGAFNLEDGSLLPLPYNPGSCNNFLPPSTWPTPKRKKQTTLSLRH